MDDRVKADGVNVPQGPKHRSRRITALLIVLAASTVLILVQRPYLAREGAGQEAVAIAEDFIEAYSNGDQQAATLLVSDTAAISISPARSPQDLEMAITWMEATAWVFTTDRCTSVKSPTEGETQRVLCYLTQENAWSRALNLEPDTRSVITIEVSSGQIVVAFLSLAPMSWPNNAAIAFDTWLAGTHPEDQERMYQYVGLPLLTPQSIELWRLYTDEYVAEQTS